MRWLAAIPAPSVPPKWIEWVTGATVPGDVGAASIVFERPLPTWGVVPRRGRRVRDRMVELP